MGINLGGGKSSGSTQANLTPQQTAALTAQTNFLTGTAIPAYQSLINGAGQVYNTVNPAANTAAQTAMNVGQQTGALQQQVGTGAYQQGAQGMGNMAAYQQGLGQGLTGTGAGGLNQGAAGMYGLGQGASQVGLGGAMGAGQFGTQKGQDFANVGGTGTMNTAGYGATKGQNLLDIGGLGSMNVAGNQAQVGQQLQNQGASSLSALFSPQYKQEQINAAMQPAREDIREQLSGQNAMFGGAGGLGSSRMALANKNMSQLGEQRLATAAATASGNVESQRQAAANALMGAGQGALGQSGNIYQGLAGQGTQNVGQAMNAYGQMAGQGLGAVQGAGSQYGNIFGQGANLMGQGTNAYGQMLNAGQGANQAAQSGYGNLATLGQQGLTGAQQAAASRIGYAQTPQGTYNQYANVIYGTPQASTTPNFAGTQGQSSNSKGFGGGARF